MKRFHVHVSVADLPASIRFYSALFAAEPTVLKSDYAKWMLDDPHVNFSISQRGIEAADTGVDHLGIQVETEAELTEMHARLAAADLPVEAQVGTNCCYAKSDKYWSVDPQGVAWESYRTLGAVPMYGQSRQEATTGAACCSPVLSPEQHGASACGSSTQSSCC
ncbi:glyoxalase/bleomycin resistance/dioxygenase family protein [Paraburkholderia steynii]|uniref:Glyoxalase/bleomycin resistance/dioxygenase family protein n=1 Tax=Paraburkholderia steynii TaxID=1245441 RepID=A0A4R0XQ31_9BURK|nr:glyoxalase/bleomycin resistance/dioxygenase family protein [Paraburkholderia steynii]